jgi:hypothetical protein
LRGTMTVELSVPIDFMCPISLDLMRDPVTLSTGQTYDRRSIEKWFETGHSTCPSTMQVIDCNDVAPNHTLQRVIRRWAVSNHLDMAVDLPKHDVPSAAGSKEVNNWLQQVSKGGVDRLNGLRKLRNLVMDPPHQRENRRLLRKVGAVQTLAQFAFSPENLRNDLMEACEMALGIITAVLLLGNTTSVLKIGPKQLTAISWYLNRGSLDARVNAAVVLTSLCLDNNEIRLLVGGTAGVFEGLVQLLKEEFYPRATDAALKAMVTIILGSEKNTVRAVEAGVVFALAELLPEAERRGQDRSVTKLLELLCFCPEGRKAVTKHALVVPMLVKIINRREPLASENAVSCLWTICQFSPKKCIDEAAAQAGILIQLSHFCQVDDSRISPETKRRAAELLRQVRHRINHCDTAC